MQGVFYTILEFVHKLGKYYLWKHRKNDFPEWYIRLNKNLKNWVCG